LTDLEAAVLWERTWAALLDAGDAQAEHQAAAEPTARYLELLEAAITSGRAHVAGDDGGVPERAQAWGWREVTVGVGDDARDEWRPQGQRIGWVDGDALYLDPGASYAAAQRQAREAGEAALVGAKTLHKRLHERGRLLGAEQDRGK